MLEKSHNLPYSIPRFNFARHERVKLYACLWDILLQVLPALPYSREIHEIRVIPLDAVCYVVCLSVVSINQYLQSSPFFPFPLDDHSSRCSASAVTWCVAVCSLQSAETASLLSTFPIVTYQSNVDCIPLLNHRFPPHSSSIS